jgi:hypothetical protein
MQTSQPYFFKEYDLSWMMLFSFGELFLLFGYLLKVAGSKKPNQ